MTSAQSSSQRQSRLAWLTPLQISQCFGKSWVLTYNSSQFKAKTDTPCTRITADALLLLMETTVDANQHDAFSANGVCSTFKSDCGRFEVRWQKQESTAERLFVQQANDYFQRLELIIDQNITATFQEPVWPHLQAPKPETLKTLMIPTSCIKWLESEPRTRALLPKGAVANSSHNDSNDQVAA